MSQALLAGEPGSRTTTYLPDAPGPRLVRAASVGAGGDAEGGSALAGLLQAIDRLEETVEQETAALRARTPIDLKDFNNRKSHGLLELTRALRHFEAAGLGETARARLARLRGKLEANRVVLQLHVEAVREVSTIMADAIREAESDGTYSASIGRRGTAA
jgi:hypothetical protein